MRILSLFILTLILSAAAAQAQMATLSGQVTDSNGDAIPRTSVKATAKNGKTFENMTNALGVYAIELPVGSYRIEFKLEQCESFVVPEYIINPATKEPMLDAEIPASKCVISDREAATDALDGIESRDIISNYYVSRRLQSQPSNREKTAPPQKFKKKNMKM